MSEKESRTASPAEPSTAEQIDTSAPSQAEHPFGAERRLPNEDDAPFEHMSREQRRLSRRPFGSRDQKLSWPPEHGFHLHWFNDEPGRIDQATEAGYDHVVDRAGKPVKRVVGTMKGGNPLLAYLMKIPQDWYEDDMAALQHEVDKVDRAIKRGQVQGPVNAQDNDAFYASAQGRPIRMTEGTGRAATR